MSKGGTNSELLASMSHELRTPLNAIIGFADLMVRGRVGELQPAQREYLGDILTSARRLLQRVDDMVALAKVEAGAVERGVEALDLARLAGEARDVARGLAAARHQRVEVAVDPGLCATRGDAARVKQALYELVASAIELAPEHATIVVRAQAVGTDGLRLAVELPCVPEVAGGG